MEAFLYQQPQFSLLDSLYLSNSPIHQNGELSNASSRFTNAYNSSQEASTLSSFFANAYNSSQEASTLSSFDDVMPLPKPQVISSEKRKQCENDGSCLIIGQLKTAKESKSRRKKPNGPVKGTMEEKKPKAKEMKATNNEEPPEGYIHVRARRGQATDSHSLAERVRRERISERMKKLQGLVPGCDKVIGKALILDEIINYVQSLQNQVEFLSMKIASVNPVYNFGVDFECAMMQPEEMGSISQTIPSRIQNSGFPLATFEGAANNPQAIDPHSSAFPLHGHLGSTALSQDNGNFLMQVGDNRRGLNQVELKNMLCYQ